MRTKIFGLFLILFITACNPYKGFKGVNTKGMKTNKTPSQELRDDYKSSSKKMNERYKREMKKNKKRLGHQE